jgi:hypothetical protein
MEPLSRLMQKLIQKENELTDQHREDGQESRVHMIEGDGENLITSKPVSVIEAFEDKEERWGVRGCFISNEASLNRNLPKGVAIKEEVDRATESKDVFPILRGHNPDMGKFGVWDKVWVEERDGKVYGYIEGLLDKRKSKVKDLWMEMAEDGEKYGLSWGGDSTDYEIKEKDGKQVAVMNNISLKEVSIVAREANPDCDLTIIKGQNTINSLNNMSDKKEKKVLENEEEVKNETPVEEPKEETPEEPKEEPKEEGKVEEKAVEESVSLNVAEFNKLKEAEKELAEIKEKQAFEETKKEISESFKVTEDKMEATVKLFTKLSTEEKALIKELSSKEEVKDNLDILKTEMVKEKSMKEVKEADLLKEAQKRAKENNTLTVDEMVNILKEQDK